MTENKKKEKKNNNVNELWHSNNINMNNIRNLLQISRNDNKTIEKELQAKLITRWITSFQIVLCERKILSFKTFFSLIRLLIKYERRWYPENFSH